MHSLNLSQPVFENSSPRQLPSGSPRRLNQLVTMRPNFHIHDSESLNRKDMENYISKKFKREYSATLYSFLPILVSMNCATGISGVAGINTAANSRLFVEQYLKDDIEHVISDLSGYADVSRNTIVEIGNLVSSNRGTSQLFFIVLAQTLQVCGFSWISFTATKQVTRIFSRLHCRIYDIGQADPTCLGEHSKNWGSYYETSPRMFFLNINEALENARHNWAQSIVLQLYQGVADQLADELAQKIPLISPQGTNNE